MKEVEKEGGREKARDSKRSREGGTESLSLRLLAGKASWTS